MSKRYLRARRLAKAKPTKKEKETLVEIVQLDAESLGIIETFLSVDHAIGELELNRPNLLRALKNKTKYKGFYWDFK